MKRRKGEKRIDFLLRAHDVEGGKRFGKRRWSNANVGWYMEDDSISSKVYGTNPTILMTWLVREGNHVQHKERDYEPLG